jgi:hypothetical protein
MAMECTWFWAGALVGEDVELDEADEDPQPASTRATPPSNMNVLMKRCIDPPRD